MISTIWCMIVFPLEDFYKACFSERENPPETSGQRCPFARVIYVTEHGGESVVCRLPTLWTMSPQHLFQLRLKILFNMGIIQEYRRCIHLLPNSRIYLNGEEKCYASNRINQRSIWGKIIYSS